MNSKNHSIKDKLTSLLLVLTGFVIAHIQNAAVWQARPDDSTNTSTASRLLKEEEKEEGDDNPALEYGIVVGIVLILILLTILFEYSKDYLEESSSRHVKPIVESLFGELTVLGFLSIFTFCVTKAGWFMTLGEALFGPDRHEELLEVFENVHYTIFFIMVFFVIQVLVLVKEANETSDTWLEYEKEMTADEDWTIRAQNVELASTHFTLKRWIYSYASALPCFRNAGTSQQREHVLVLYKALRDEFVLDRELDYPFTPSAERVEDDFNFGRYLGVCQASFLQKVVRVKISTWVFFAIGVVLYYLFCLMVHCNETVLGWTWAAMAWSLCLYNIHFERHLIGVISAFASKGVYYMAHHGQEPPPADNEMTELLSSEPGPRGQASNEPFQRQRRLEWSVSKTDSSDHLLPDWCRVDIEHYLENRPYLTRCLAGGVPNRQQALYWMDRKGPPLYLFILQFDLLFVGIFSAVQFIQVGPYMYHSQPTWAFALYVVLATLPILNIAVNKKRLVAVLTPVCSLGFYRRPQVIASVIREEKMSQGIRTFIVVYKLRRFAMQAEPAKKKELGVVHYSHLFDRQEIAEVGRTFDEFDLDGSGSITAVEFEKLMSRLGAHLTQEQLRRMVEGLDSDKSGGVDKDEFIQWYADRSRDDDISEEEFAHFMFQIFDTNGSGELTIGELKKKLDQVSNRFNMDEIVMLVNELDSNNDGTICEEEFENLIKKFYPRELSHGHH